MARRISVFADAWATVETRHAAGREPGASLLAFPGSRWQLCRDDGERGGYRLHPLEGLQYRTDIEAQDSLRQPKDNSCCDADGGHDETSDRSLLPATTAGHDRKAEAIESLRMPRSTIAWYIRGRRRSRLGLKPLTATDQSLEGHDVTADRVVLETTPLLDRCAPAIQAGRPVPHVSARIAERSVLSRLALGRGQAAGHIVLDAAGSES